MPRSQSFPLNEGEDLQFNDPVLQEGAELAKGYGETATNMKEKYRTHMISQEEKKENGAADVLSEETEATAAAAAVVGAPSFTDRLAAGAKHGAEAIQHSFQNASAALKRRTSDIGGIEKVLSEKEQAPVAEHAEDEAGPNAAAKLKGALQDLGKKTMEASSAAYENLRRLAIQDRRIAVVCKQEFQQKPCPQTLLVCCTVLVCKGLEAPFLFKTDAIPPEITETHAALLGNSVLVPNSMEPTIAAAVMKHFLASLDEPLLIRKLADQWIAAGSDPADAKIVMADMPLANLSALRVLMETCNRLATYSRAGVTAHELASELVPVLLWRLPAADAANAPVNPRTDTTQNSWGSIQALKSRLLSFKFGSAVDADAKAQKESTKEEDAILEGTQSPADVASPMGESAARTSKDAGTAAKTGEGQLSAKPQLTKAEVEAVVRVVEHLITNFDDCFMTSTTA